MKLNIAAIVPLGRGDSSADTVLDGFLELQKEHPEIIIHTSAPFDSYLNLEAYQLEQKTFIEFASTADIILLFYGKKKTDIKLAEDIGRWNKTVFIDGSEVGGDLRYDADIQRAVLDGNYHHFGRIDEEMLIRCALYFRREKPYRGTIIPLPFGIDSPYTKHYRSSTVKDIDFCCVFGQEQHPPLRRVAREVLEMFCNENGFSCWTKNTKTPEEFHKILARSKVGISIGGGGFDTMRFWEILGNNCLLLTEHIDVYPIDSTELAYQRIFQFNNLFDFQYQLEFLGTYLKNVYHQESLQEEYQTIMGRHSSKARVLTIIHEAGKRGII